MSQPIVFPCEHGKKIVNCKEAALIVSRYIESHAQIYVTLNGGSGYYGSVARREVVIYANM